MRPVHIMEYYSGIRKQEVLIQAMVKGEPC